MSKILITAGANLNIQKDGKTPLEYAIIENNTEIIELLQQYNA